MGTPFRRLDPIRLTSLLLPRECAIDRLRYFTARVSGKVDPRAPARQHIYMKALATLPEVEIHDGRFLAKTAWRPLANLPEGQANHTDFTVAPNPGQGRPSSLQKARKGSTRVPFET